MSFRVRIKPSATRKDPLIQKVQKKRGKILSFKSEEKAKEWVDDLSRWSLKNPSLQESPIQNKDNSGKTKINAYLTAK